MFQAGGRLPVASKTSTISATTLTTSTTDVRPSPVLTVLAEALAGAVGSVSSTTLLEMSSLDTLYKYLHFLYCCIHRFSSCIRTRLDLLSIPQSRGKNVKTFRWDQRLCKDDICTCVVSALHVSVCGKERRDLICLYCRSPPLTLGREYESRFRHTTWEKNAHQVENDQIVSTLNLTFTVDEGKERLNRERLFAVHGLSERTTVQTSSLLLRLFFFYLLANPTQPDPYR